MKEFSTKDVGRSLAEALSKGGREGVATVVGYWMFTHVNDRHEFFGSASTAVRQVWGTNEVVSKDLSRFLSKRLNRNGFRFRMTDNGPRWIAPDTWTWEHHDDPEADPVPTIAGPVRTSYECATCHERFPDAMALARHTKSHVGNAPHGLEKKVLAIVRGSDAPMTSDDVGAALGINPRSAAQVLARLAKQRRIRRERYKTGTIPSAMGVRYSSRRSSVPVAIPTSSKVGPTKELVLAALAEGPASYKDLGRKIGKSRDAVKQAMRTLIDGGTVVQIEPPRGKHSGTWSLAPTNGHASKQAERLPHAHPRQHEDPPSHAGPFAIAHLHSDEEPVPNPAPESDPTPAVGERTIYLRGTLYRVVRVLEGGALELEEIR